MNRTSIEYVDFSWNPVTGCLGPGGRPDEPKRCSYCYAHRLANGRLRNLYLANTANCLHPIGCDWLNYDWDPFWPRLWPARLNEPKARNKPAHIFVVDMGDLFHPHIPMIWQKMVYEVICRCPQHTFLLLTKNPLGYSPFQPWPDNCWLGTTITCQRDWDERWPELEKVEAKVRWVSFEPLLGHISDITDEPDWFVIGQQTGAGAKRTPPHTAKMITDAGWMFRIPVFHKDNLELPAGIERRREFPR